MPQSVDVPSMQDGSECFKPCLVVEMCVIGKEGIASAVVGD